MGTQASTPLAKRRSNVRRGFLAALVVGCLLVFTAYSTEGDGGPLHGFQGAVGALIAPIQGGTTRAVQPLRDAWDWGTSLVDARDEAARLKTENEQLKTQLVQQGFDHADTQRIEALKGLGDDFRTDYTQVPASIVGLSVAPWYHRARLNRGRDDGIRVNSPVLARGDAEGLAGLITEVYPGSSVVTFISEPRTSIGVTIEGADGARGILSPSGPNQLQVTGIPADKPVSKGQPVFTAGFSGLRVPSIYPRGIPIGLVMGAGGSDTDVVQKVQVAAFVNPRDLAYVVVLAPTSRDAINRAKTP
ncbi:MAG: rod shape-determining protein MreC [Thermoleophilia bacterium]|nr:rod shape-determining protein MreC [Thermoleophilia bacterium]